MKRYHIKVLTGLAAFFALLFSPGCEKVETDITYEIYSYLSLPDVDSLIPYCSYVRIFTHYRDTTNWWVKNYEDAATGKITRKNNSEADNRAVQESWSDNDTIPVVIGPFGRGPVTLVAYDPEYHGKYRSRMYAWRQIAVEAGIDTMRIRLVFTPEKLSQTYVRKERSISPEYRENDWRISNDNPWVEPTTGQ